MLTHSGPDKTTGRDSDVSLDFYWEINKGSPLFLSFKNVDREEDFLSVGVVRFPDPTVGSRVTDSRQSAFAVGVVRLAETKINGGDLGSGSVGEGTKLLNAGHGGINSAGLIEDTQDILESFRHGGG